MLNTRAYLWIWIVTCWIPSLQEQLELTGDELLFLCAAALNGALETSDRRLPNFLPTIIFSETVLFVAALALKALHTCHPFVAHDEANPGLAPGCFLLYVLSETGERWRETACVEGTKGFCSAKGSLQPGGISMSSDWRGVLKPNPLTELCGEGKWCSNGVFFSFLWPVFKKGVFGFWKTPTSCRRIAKSSY